MSGILNNKSRVIDAILTYEGRSQLASGKFVVKYASFSDTNVYYESSLQEGHVDPTPRIYLESYQVPQDEITFTADDSGRLIPFRQQSNVNFSEASGSTSWSSFVLGKIKNRTNITGSFSEEAVLGATFTSQIEGILTSSIDNFSKLRIIGSSDSIFEDENFALSSNEIEFTLLKNSETLQMVPATNVNTIDSLFNDEKLRNVENFMYLPPIKKSTFSVDKTNLDLLKKNNLLLGDYPAWGPIEKLGFSQLKLELNKYEDFSKIISFDPTSRDNDIVAQVFEITNDEARKLDVIDYGRVNDNSSNPRASSHHAFFVGKVFVDDNGSDCFVHLFTLMFSGDEEI